MFTFAHISDIHLGPLPRLTVRELASKRITGFINWHRNRRKHLLVNTLDLLLSDMRLRSPDHLMITGDLVNLATSIEIRLAAEWLESVGDPIDTTVVPGNHDAYVPGAHDRSVNAWYPFIAGDASPREWTDDEHLFPTYRRRGPVAIIGCSTSNATLPFSAGGYFSARQARETANLLRQAKADGLFRVVLIHHPPIRGAAPSHKRMIGIRRFAAALSLGGAELILHGHTHLNTLYMLRTHHGEVPVLGIASASQGPGGHKPAAAYNYFTLTGEPGAWNLACDRYGLNAAADAIEHEQRRVLLGQPQELPVPPPLELDL
ncbi:metallophosphoesterase [Rhizobium sp. SSA_523]|uniref:metallophosphoesterase family protein n=1 Tax=Rhizobium sp. SSA_523 TaxID=2952477 RepID=UPI0020910D46|nr:metallophosphoesterase [Rhizobium sp. SSA_523]MCO5730447.1 metallophosphoesterase [Rhizobium sp. SSA_523]WKC25489.1 metallophosphoesterase [Rhizobium sp. SSA_523]